MKTLVLATVVAGSLIVPIASLAVAAPGSCSGSELLFSAGVADEFALPMEATAPSTDYADWMDEIWPGSTERQFDVEGSHMTLIHTFVGWAAPVCGAQLEIRLQAGSSGLSTDDSIRLALVGGLVPETAFRYSTTIANVVGSWGAGTTATLELDLSDLPPSASFPTNLLDSLGGGTLDLAVDDDTAVDYAVLHVCSCPTSVEKSSWGRTKAAYVGRPDE